MFLGVSTDFAVFDICRLGIIFLNDQRRTGPMYFLFSAKGLDSLSAFPSRLKQKIQHWSRVESRMYSVLSSSWYVSDWEQLSLYTFLLIDIRV